jgi:hypothetical protein
MFFFARRIEHPLDVAVHCPHDGDSREYRRAAPRLDQCRGRKSPLLKVWSGVFSSQVRRNMDH